MPAGTKRRKRKPAKDQASIIKKISEKAKQTKDSTAKAVHFITGDSKKIILTLGFLVSVILDRLHWADVVYGEDLFASKVFWSIVISIVVILTKDMQNLAHDFKDAFLRR